MKKILSIIILGLIITSNCMAYEEANYEVVKKNEVYEIRKYSDRLAIETEICQIKAVVLENYLIISLVIMRIMKRLKMTTPVTQVEKKGNMTMQFYLPSRFNKENIPSLIHLIQMLRY